MINLSSMLPNGSFETDNEVLEDVLVEEHVDTGNDSSLIVYNDDHNIFDWVIECFMEVCNHTFEQSEQLAMIVHFKGKATVKKGNFSELKRMKDALTDRGLSAVIEKEKSR